MTSYWDQGHDPGTPKHIFTRSLRPSLTPLGALSAESSTKPWYTVLVLNILALVDMAGGGDLSRVATKRK